MVAWQRLSGGWQLPTALQYWRRHLKAGIPEYLARHYWWAYLSHGAVRVFDHPAIISAILFGNYRILMRAVLKRLKPHNCGRFLQFTSVYGELIPSLHDELDITGFHLTDIAPVQLDSALKKTNAPGGKQGVMASQANVECLPYADNSFDTLLIFFLLHELPEKARKNALLEAMRILRPGGRLIVVEYAELTQSNWLHRNPVSRSILEFVEPYLENFWRGSLRDQLEQAAMGSGKKISQQDEEKFFHGFYRLLDMQIDV